MSKILKDIQGHWCEETVKALIEMGVVHGDGEETFEPDKECTKAEAATMIRNAIMYITGK